MSVWDLTVNIVCTWIRTVEMASAQARPSGLYQWGLLIKYVVSYVNRQTGVATTDECKKDRICRK